LFFEGRESAKEEFLFSTGCRRSFDRVLEMELGNKCGIVLAAVKKSGSLILFVRKVLGCKWFKLRLGI
jgi:hypothetical protein